MGFLLLKLVHILAVAIGVGGMAAQYVLLLSYRRSEEHALRRVSESMAYTILKKVASRALLLALILGLSMVAVHTSYLKFAYMHSKMLLAFILVGWTHIEMANLRKMQKAAEGKDEVLVNTLKKRHSLFMAVGSLLIVAIFSLIVLKPF